MNEEVIPHVDSGVADFAALLVPEVESISSLEILKASDWFADQGLLCGCSRQINSDLAKKLLHESGAVDAAFEVVSAPLVRRADVLHRVVQHRRSAC